MGEGKFMTMEDGDSVKGHTQVAAKFQINSMEALVNVLSDDKMDNGTSP